MKSLQVSLFDIVMSVSNVIDMISPRLNGHHKTTAYLAVNIAKDIGLSVSEQTDIFLAGLLHDCGALSLQDKINALEFEIEYPDMHAENGYRFLKGFKCLKNAANIIRYHHVNCMDIEDYTSRGVEVPIGSCILNIADRVEVLMDKGGSNSEQIKGICARVEEESGRKFTPELTNSFLKSACNVSFWSDLHESMEQNINNQELQDTVLNFENILQITKLFEKIIDFRSRFTATHSSGVAASAEALARFMGLSEGKCSMLKVAGYLHDIGKLAVPVEYIEKPGRLTEKEYGIVKNHAVYSYKTLKNIKGFEEINKYGSFHHERLDGKGYPFGLTEESLMMESRILCVADVFTAITEDRPYRKGMDSTSSLKVLKNLVENRGLDGEVVKVLVDNYEKINSIRVETQLSSRKEYEEFWHDMDS